MLSLDKMCFVTVSLDYLSALHAADHEVFYSENAGYENKPHIGILLNSNGFDYVIPLTSAKPKHKNWNTITPTNCLIYEDQRRCLCSSNDVIKEINPTDNPGPNDIVRKIMAVIEIKKMIPVKEGTYHILDFNAFNENIPEERKRKALLQHEYLFCLGIQDKIIERANNILDEQHKSGYVKPFYCNFSLLENICKNYPV